jgi:glucosyl-3-phosphoglycerate synthase
VHERVRQWYAHRGSHLSQWSLPAVLDSKGDTRVSVVLPALNEQSTVGPIVAAIRRALVERGLVDELVVMDSGCTDGTARVAAAAGARVVRREEVLPGFEPLPGKGEVLWRSLAATTGDVLVFVDADLREFTPSFVVALLGPLLADPGVHLVKAAYDRPLAAGRRLTRGWPGAGRVRGWPGAGPLGRRAPAVAPAGGGRVTELVARPLLNLHWPELAGFAQPLSGEYAARRRLLERLPFPTGYGVELGLLVGALRLVGLDGLAQVDLCRRRHRHQSDARLGVMASEILRTALRRLEEEGRLTLAGPVGTALTQFERSGTGYRMLTTEVCQIERPPLADVPAYRARPMTAGRRAP